MLRQRSVSVRNIFLALSVTIVCGAVVDAGCSREGESCRITCTGVTQGLSDLIKEQYNKMRDTCTTLDSLTVDSSSFPDQTLKSGWLPAEVPLNGSLTFSKCNFITIDNDAFHGDHFTGVVSLHLHDLNNLLSLERDHLSSMKNLDTLEMRQLPNIEHIEDGVLSDNVKLSTLQFSNGGGHSVSSFLANITGNNNDLPNLQTVDLGHNNLGALEPAFFTSFARSRVVQLYLNAANVTAIPPGTIPITFNLAKLELSENRMITLTADFYSGTLRDGAKIYLGDNPFTCSCDLVWMINMTNIDDYPTCVFPGPSQEIYIKNNTEEVICGDGGPTTTSTPSSSVTDPTVIETTSPTAPTTTTIDLTTETTIETTTVTDQTIIDSTTQTMPITTSTTDLTTETTTDQTIIDSTTQTMPITTSTTDLTTETTTETTTVTDQTIIDSTTQTMPITTSTTDLTTETTTDQTIIDSTTPTMPITTSSTDRTTETTTETTTVTVMPPTNGNVMEECEDGGLSSSFSDVDDPGCGDDGAESEMVIQMFECVNGEKIHVRVADTIKAVDLFVWSNTTQTYNGTCLRYNSTSSGFRSFYVTGLSASESFIVCAVSIDYGINVRHCGAHTMQPVNALRPWLTNGQQGSYIIGAALVGLAIVVASGFITVKVIRRRPTLIGPNVEKVEWWDENNNRREAFMVTPRDYRPSSEDPPEPLPRPEHAVYGNVPSPRHSQLSEKSTISYISVPRLSQTSSRSRFGIFTTSASSPRPSDASSTSYISIIETIRSFGRFTGSIVSGYAGSSNCDSDTIYERRDSDIPYVQLSQEDLMSTDVPLCLSRSNSVSQSHKHNNPLSRLREKVTTAFAKRKDKFNVMQETQSSQLHALASSTRVAMKAPRSLSNIENLHRAFEIPPPTGHHPRTTAAAETATVIEPPAAMATSSVEIIRCDSADADVTRYVSRKKNTTPWRTLKKKRIPISSRSRKLPLNAQDLIQRQLHMFDYTVFEDMAEEEELHYETADDFVPDVEPSPVAVDIRRELVVDSSLCSPEFGSPTSITSSGSRRDGFLFPPVGEDAVTNTKNPLAEVAATIEDSGFSDQVDDEGLSVSPTSSELRRSLEDSLVLEALEKGDVASRMRRGNAEVEERALLIPSGMWNHAPHTWSTTIPTLRLQEDLEDASGA